MGPELGVSILGRIRVEVWVLHRVIPLFLSFLFTLDDLVADHHQSIIFVIKDVVNRLRLYQGSNPFILLGLGLFRTISFSAPTGLLGCARVAIFSCLISIEAQVGTTILIVLGILALRVVT